MASIKDYKPSGLSNLKKNVKAAWLHALRGNLKQITGKLRGKREDGRIGYCCLGVLCNLGKDADEKWTVSRWATEYYYDGQGGMPPDYVLERAGLFKEDAEILAYMNDNNIGFKRIANWIEKYL